MLGRPFPLWNLYQSLLLSVGVLLLWTLISRIIDILILHTTYHCTVESPHPNGFPLFSQWGHLSLCLKHCPDHLEQWTLCLKLREICLMMMMSCLPSKLLQPFQTFQSWLQLLDLPMAIQSICGLVLTSDSRLFHCFRLSSVQHVTKSKHNWM